MKKFTLFFLINLFFQNQGIAQSDLTLYNMSTIGAAAQVNCSQLPDKKFYLSLPVIGSMKIMFSNNSFTYRDLYKIRSDDSVFLDIENTIGKMKENNCIMLQMRMDILAFGFKLKKNYIHANITERGHFYFNYPGQFFRLLEEGNGKYLGQILDFKKLGFDVSHFREYGIGLTRELNDKWTAGIRLKSLYGMENFSSTTGNLSLRTDANDYGLFINSNISINTSSSLGDLAESNLSTGTYLTGLGNRGLATDLGVTYKYNSKWTFNASLNDLGYINWKNNVKNYVINSGKFSFEGIDIKSVINDSSNTSQNILDSLSNSFNSEERSTVYKTNLPTQLYLGGNYKFSEKESLSGIFHLTMMNNKTLPSTALSYNRKFGNYLSLAATWSWFNQRYDNLGLGLSIQSKTVQFYILSDNLIGTINPLSGNFSQLHFGINVLLRE